MRYRKTGYNRLVVGELYPWDRDLETHFTESEVGVS